MFFDRELGAWGLIQYIQRKTGRKNLLQDPTDREAENIVMNQDPVGANVVHDYSVFGLHVQSELLLPELATKATEGADFVSTMRT
ncbi:MAG TPA: hypothetical protein VGC38_02295 [Pseudolabrys sp.]